MYSVYAASATSMRLIYAILHFPERGIVRWLPLLAFVCVVFVVVVVVVVVVRAGATLFSDYQALMRIWTHPWCLKLEALRRPERFDDTDNSLDDFIVHTDEDTEEEEEVESLKTTTSEDGSASNSVADSDESDEQESDQRSAGDDEKREGVRKGKGPGLGEERRSRRAPLTSAPGAVDEKSDASAEMDGPNAIGSTRSGATFKDEVSDVEPEKEWYDDFVTDDDQSNVELSGKLVLLMEILADAEAVGDKVLVFSHSLVTLDLIERALGGGEVGGDRENWCRGCDYFRMDGSTSASMRQRWAEIFNSKDNETWVSCKARVHMLFFMRFWWDFDAILRTKRAPVYPARVFSRVTLRKKGVFE